ncbi:TldD/PmbA family protein [Candidatus Micrarchaeota archaeon]|nr:TldD/PmbA family protein [Candidatus Micrarchaeota archaeon]
MKGSVVAGGRAGRQGEITCYNSGEDAVARRKFAGVRALVETVAGRVARPCLLDAETVFRAMRAETRRFMRHEFEEELFGKKVKFHPGLISYMFKLFEERKIVINDGALVSDNLRTHNELTTAAKVGGKKGSGSGCDCNTSTPLENDYNSLRRALWRSSLNAVSAAVSSYAEEIGKQKKELTVLSEEERIVDIRTDELAEFDASELVGALKFLTSQMARKKWITAANARVSVEKQSKFFLNSEGTRIKTSEFYLTISLDAKMVLDGKEHSLGMQFNLRDPSKLDLALIYEKAENLVAKLAELRKAPKQEPGVYPVLLDGEMHGVCWHEAIGHGLEAHRLGVEDDAGSFGAMIGKKIAPPFVRVEDDPTLKGRWGSYEYDDEGVRAQRVVLVKRGVLESYLHSRGTAGKKGVKSNGHARAGSVIGKEEEADSGIPTPRMSNMKIEASRGKRKTFEQLVEQLKEICREKELEYGLYCVGSEGGEVDTNTGHFKFIPKETFRIYVDGRVERVRDAVVIGTPYQLLSQIVACGSDKGGMTGHCGAESGWVTSEEIAPHALLKSAEIARRNDYEKAEHLLPPPKFVEQKK